MKKRIIVTQEVEIEYDPSKFTKEFLDDFRKYFYDLEDVDEHLIHLAQMAARGLISDWDMDESVEGYGKLSTMGIEISILNNCQHEEIEDAPSQE